jgi:hypothetical protein
MGQLQRRSALATFMELIDRRFNWMPTLPSDSTTGN